MFNQYATKSKFTRYNNRFFYLIMLTHILMKSMVPEFRLLNENNRFLQNRKFCTKLRTVLLFIKKYDYYDHY